MSFCIVCAHFTGLTIWATSSAQLSAHQPGMKKVWWYGYGEKFARQMEGFVDMQFARGWAAKLRGAVKAAGVLGKSKR